MTPDQVVRACDYVQAVHEGDDAAAARLDEHEYGQLPTRHLLVAFLELAVTGAGILEAASDGAPSEERQDLAAALSGVLVRGVREWAETAQEDVGEDGQVSLGDFTSTSEGIARTIGSFLLATTAGPPGELKSRLDAFRTAAAAA